MNEIYGRAEAWKNEVVHFLYREPIVVVAKYQYS
jgi:hypothetical protein